MWKQDQGRGRVGALYTRSAKWRLTSRYQLHRRKQKQYYSEPVADAGNSEASDDPILQRLLGTLVPSKPVVQERSAVTELETMLLNWLPVGTVMEKNVASPETSAVSAEECFSCGALTHTTENFRFCLWSGRRNVLEISSF